METVVGFCSKGGSEPRSPLALFYERLRECARVVRGRAGVSFTLRTVGDAFFVEAGGYGIKMSLSGGAVKYEPYGEACILSDFILSETDMEVPSVLFNLLILEAPLLDEREGNI